VSALRGSVDVRVTRAPVPTTSYRASMSSSCSRGKAGGLPGLARRRALLAQSASWLCVRRHSKLRVSCLSARPSSHSRPLVSSRWSSWTTHPHAETNRRLTAFASRRRAGARRRILRLPCMKCHTSRGTSRCTVRGPVAWGPNLTAGGASLCARQA